MKGVITQKPISARIDIDTLKYCQANGGRLNTLINQLLKNWMMANQEKQMLMFQEETGQTDFAKNTESIEHLKNSNCCKNCKYLGWKGQWDYSCDNPEKSTDYHNEIIDKMCCIYWEKKKGRK